MIAARARRRNWLGSTALLGLSVSIAVIAISVASIPANASPFIGDDGQPGTTPGGGSGGAAGDASPASGDGGAGSTNLTAGSTGSGAAGGAGGAVGFIDAKGGGAESGGGGGLGGNGTGGGGGGGGGRSVTLGGASPTLVVTATGGNGGKGGDGSGTTGTGGGGGGGGGNGAVVTATGTVTINANVLGGNGGDGGLQGAVNGSFGSGGAGGNGVVVSTTGVTLSINAAVAGGAGGARGGLRANESDGAGGAGIVGSGITVKIGSTGSVTGGMDGANAIRADAITFTGGTNNLAFGSIATSSPHLTGNIDVQGSAIVFLAGVSTIVDNVITGTGQVKKSGTGAITLNATDTYTGATTVVAGTLIIGGSGSITSDVTNSATFDNYGTVTGNLTNTTGTSFNQNRIDGAVTVNGGTLTTAGTITGGLTNRGTTNAAGIVDGTVINQGTGILTVTGALVGNSNLYNNNTAQLLVTGGDFTGIGSLTNNSTAAVGINIAASRTLSAASIANNAGATISNAGTLTTTGGTTNKASATLTTTGTINGGLSNRGTANASGAVNGAIVNQGTGIFNVTGALVGNGNLNNNNTAQLLVSGGDFTGISGLTNSSTAAVGVNVAAGRTLGATSVVNNAGATISNAGTLTTTGGTINQASGTLTTTGTINGGLANRGTTNASGAIGGTIVNQGAGIFNVTGGLAGSGDLNNNNTAQLLVSSGDFTGIASLTNNSTAAVGINIAASRTLSAASVVNNAGATISNAGMLTATGGITNNLGGTITNNGTVHDDLNNAGVVTNNGTYVANVAGNSGTITNNNIWNGNVLSNAGSIVNAASATWTGDVSTGGTFTNAGTITGSLTNTAGTTTNSGNISGAVTVSGGNFNGTGSTGGMIVGNGGAFAPGNGTPGTSATINGSLAFSSSAFYQVAINPTTASFVNTTGTATLGGASVQAFFGSGTYVSKQYAILNASGGVIGTFNSLANTNLPSGFTSTLSYDATHAYLNLALNFTPSGPSPPVFGALNVNQQNVATTLVNFFNSTGSIPIVFGSLTSSGLTQVSGELATGEQQTTFNAMNLFMGVLTDPFVAGRGNGIDGSANATGYADEDGLAYAKRRPNSALGAIYTKARPMTPSFEQRWSVWAAGYGGSQSTDGNAGLGSNNTTSSVYGTAVGADYRFSPDTIAGFALAGGGTNFNVNGAGSGHSDLFQAGAFVRHNIGAAYITGALAYGWQDITTNRTVTVAGIDQLRARFNANAYSGRLEGGYRYVTPFAGGIGVTPYAAGQFTTFDLPNYAESVLSGAGTFALNYSSKSVTDTRSELGIRTDRSFALPNAILTLRGRAAWAHDYNPDRSIAATFQTLPGASFIVNGAAQASDSALVTASAEWKWVNGWSAAATFEGEFSGVSTSYAGKGVVRYAW